MGTAKAANRRFVQMENKVHQALAVMNKQTDQLLTYCQLMRNPKYKKAWNISAANEFEQLTQGVGGHIKGTNTNVSSFDMKYPKIEWKM